MLVQLLLDALITFLQWIINLIPDSISFPNSLLFSIDHVLDIIFSNLGFLNMFIRISTIKTLVPLVIFVVSFELVYHLIFWVIKKLPFLNIS